MTDITARAVAPRDLRKPPISKIRDRLDEYVDALPTAAGHAPKGGELRDGQPLKPGEYVTADTGLRSAERGHDSHRAGRLATSLAAGGGWPEYAAF